MDNDIPVPAALQKVGIMRVTDNIPEGMQLDVRSSFLMFFGPALERKMIERARRKLAEKGQAQAKP